MTEFFQMPQSMSQQKRVACTRTAPQVSCTHMDAQQWSDSATSSLVSAKIKKFSFYSSAAVWLSASMIGRMLLARTTKLKMAAISCTQMHIFQTVRREKTKVLAGGPDASKFVTRTTHLHIYISSIFFEHYISSISVWIRWNKQSAITCA
jgi:hypothetical protein